jgi:CheY-like chemotaxis protein
LKTRMRILLVDDYDDARESTRLMLEMRGWQVVEARDGREAVERAVEETPDLILMDLQMPVMDGFAAAHCLRESETTRVTPIIAISAHREDTWVERAMANGFTDYMSKPLQYETLLDVLMRYLPDAEV